MIRLCKYMVLMVACLLMLSPVSADDSVFIGDGDIGGILLYDSQGNKLDSSVEVVSNIGEGWIIYTPDTPILIITPKGTINLYEQSILVTGDLLSNSPELYLVKGKATFNTFEDFTGSLSISTPVSLFKLSGEGEMLVITTDDEESVTSFKGKVSAFNAISKAKTTINTFEKLFMHEKMPKTKAIDTGYYLSYATYPDLMMAKQMVSEMAKPVVATIPSAPKSSVVLYRAKEPSFSNVTIMPMEPPTFKASVEPIDLTNPIAPQLISVKTERIIVPPRPQTITSTRIPAPLKRIIITVRPFVPDAVTSLSSKREGEPPAVPSIKLVKVQEEIITVEAEPTPLEIQSETKTVETSDEIQEEPVVVEATSEVAMQSTDAPSLIASKEKPQVILSTQASSTTFFSRIGLNATYSFIYDNSNGNMTNLLTINPYLFFRNLGLSLQGTVSTSDFTSFSSNATASSGTTIEKISYVSNFIDALRIGYSSSNFFLALDKNRYNNADWNTFFTPQFGENTKLGLYNKIEIGSFAVVATFDDMYLENLLENKPQYGSFAFQFAKQEGYQFSMSIGTSAKIQNTPSWAVDLYPQLSFRFPIINTRTIQFNALFQASGYLPIYPTVQGDQFVDSSVSSLFPNYLLSTGFSIKSGSISTRLLASLREGENRNLLANELSYTYDSGFDVLADIGYEHQGFKTRLVWNIPFVNDFQLAKITSTIQTADFSQFTFSYTKDAFTLGLGIEHLGIFDTIISISEQTSDLSDFFGGAYSTSFITFAYEAERYKFSAKAYYPVDGVSRTVPVIAVSARLKLDKQF